MSTGNSSKGNIWIGIIVGAILTVAGSQMAFKHQPEFLYDFTDNLGHQGIPLDLGKTVATIGVFLILFPVVRTFFVTPLSDAINARASELESTFSEAESLRAEMSTLRSDYERRLSETEAQA